MSHSNPTEDSTSNIYLSSPHIVFQIPAGDSKSGKSHLITQLESDRTVDKDHVVHSPSITVIKHLNSGLAEPCLYWRPRRPGTVVIGFVVVGGIVELVESVDELSVVVVVESGVLSAVVVEVVVESVELSVVVVVVVGVVDEGMVELSVVVVVEDSVVEGIVELSVVVVVVVEEESVVVEVVVEDDSSVVEPPVVDVVDGVEEVVVVDTPVVGFGVVVGGVCVVIVVPSVVVVVVVVSWGHRLSNVHSSAVWASRSKGDSQLGQM